MCEEVKIASQLLDITKILTEKNSTFSINLSFHINTKDFTFNASSLKKDQDAPITLEKRKMKSPSRKARNLKRWNEHKEKLKEKLETSTSPHTPSDITLAKQDDTLIPSVSCDECGHTTKTENGIKLHKKKKHEIPQIDGNTSVTEEQIQEEDFNKPLELKFTIPEKKNSSEIYDAYLADPIPEVIPKMVVHPFDGIGVYDELHMGVKNRYRYMFKTKHGTSWKNLMCGENPPGFR